MHVFVQLRNRLRVVPLSRDAKENIPGKNGHPTYWEQEASERNAFHPQDNRFHVAIFFSQGFLQSCLTDSV